MILYQLEGMYLHIPMQNMMYWANAVLHTDGHITWEVILQNKTNVPVLDFDSVMP